MSTTSDTAVFVVGFRWEAAVPEQGIVGCFHRTFPVAGDEVRGSLKGQDGPMEGARPSDCYGGWVLFRRQPLSLAGAAVAFVRFLTNPAQQMKAFGSSCRVARGSFTPGRSQNRA